MAIITQAQNLNVRPGAQSQTVVHVSQGDTGSTILFYLYDGDSEIDVTAYTVSVHGVRADGVGWGPYGVSNVSNVSNGVQFNLRSVMTAIGGPGLAELSIANASGAIVGTANFAVLVEQGTFPNGPVYSSDISVYQQILSYVQNTIIPTGAVTIDNTLSISGAAADAKTTGDSITALGQTVEENRNGYGKYNAWSVVDAIPAKTETINGISFAYDGHGTVTFSGTNSAAAIFYLLQRQSKTQYMPVDAPYIIDFDTASEKAFVQLSGQDSGGNATTIYSGTSAKDVQVSLASSYVTISLRMVIQPGTHNGSVKIGLQSLREKDYVDGLVVEDAVDAVVAMSPIFDQAVRIRKGPTIAGGIEYKANDGVITYVGTRTGTSIFQLLNASDISPFKKGHTFYVSFNGNDVMYLQLLIDGVELLSGKLYDSEPVVIPTSFTTFNFRVLINASGTYDDVATLSIREETDVYQDLKISTSTELYNFLQSPIPFTRLILEPKTYDLYTSRYQNDILNDSFVAKYLSNVEIVGNGATISLMVPQSVCLEHLATCNKIGGLSVGGNVEVSDLTIMTQNIRYCLHDESLGTEANFYTVHKYTNVYFYHSITSPETIGVVGNTIGIGGSLGQRYLFERCTFENTTSRGTFYIHGRNYNIGELSFDGCYFVPKQSGHDLVPYQYTGNGLDMPINIVNSYVGTCYIRMADGGVSDCQWKVTAINSYVPNLIFGSNLTSIPTPKRIDTINGTIDTTYQTN